MTFDNMKEKEGKVLYGGVQVVCVTLKTSMAMGIRVQQNSTELSGYI